MGETDLTRGAAQGLMALTAQGLLMAQGLARRGEAPMPMSPASASGSASASRFHRRLPIRGEERRGEPTRAGEPIRGEAAGRMVLKEEEQ